MVMYVSGRLNSFKVVSVHHPSDVTFPVQVLDCFLRHHLCENKGAKSTANRDFSAGFLA